MLVFPNVNANSPVDPSVKMREYILDNKKSVLETLNNKLEIDAKELKDVSYVIVDRIKIENEVYSKSPDIIYKPLMLRKHTYENNSDVEQQEFFEYSETIQDTFSFGFKETIKVGAKVSAGINIEILSAGVEISTEVSFEANQQWTSTKSTTWKERTTINVPPHSKVEASAFINQGTISDLNYSADVVIIDAYISILLADVGKFTLLPVIVKSPMIGFPKDIITYPITADIDAAMGVNSAVKITQTEINNKPEI